MKTFLTLAAVTAILATSTLAQANDRAGGHWESRNSPSFGPKSTVPSRTRVWVKDGEAHMANCDCAMIKTDASCCTMDMSGKGRAPSAG